MIVGALNGALVVLFVFLLLSICDPYLAEWAAVDKAVGAAVAVGAIVGALVAHFGG